MESKKQLFIDADLNDYYDGYFPLRNPKAIQKLTDEYGPLQNGLKIWIYAIGYGDKKPDLLVFPGSVQDLEVENDWKIYVDEKDITDLTESKEFKEYGVRDVVGDEQFDLIKSKYPELK
jgi:hypothetical protein